jgi:hypothetical protein
MMTGPSKEWLLKMAELEDGKCTSVGGLLCDVRLYKRPNRTFKPGDTLRMPHYATAGGFRVWTVQGVHLGGEKQEGTYHLRVVDMKDNLEIHVPCIILETHPEIELV